MTRHDPNYNFVRDTMGRTRRFILADYASLERSVAARMAAGGSPVARRAGANAHPQGSPLWRSVKRVKLLAVSALLRQARSRLIPVLQDDGQLPELWHYTGSTVDEWAARHHLIRPLDTLIRIIDEETELLRTDWSRNDPSGF